MEISALNRMMREGPSISGHILSVDPEKLPALYSQLKQTPAVAGVAVRVVMLELLPHDRGESAHLDDRAESFRMSHRNWNGLQRCPGRPL